MPKESRLQNTPRYGGMRTVDDPSTYTENQETLTIGNHSRKLSKPLKELFLTLKSRKSPIRIIDLGNSWIRLTSANYQWLKPSSTTISCAYLSIACGTLFIGSLTQLFITTSISASWMKLKISKSLSGLYFQKRNSRLL